MKLLAMHVDDFGCLHDYTYEFQDGLNVFLEENGWGKTTLAAFLKAMLYGFDNKRTHDITENERRRYAPWQGGKYGGSLDFEMDGHAYRVFRTFGLTPRYDTARVVDLERNITARIAPDDLGEKLFGLDASAFQRSVFINQNGLQIDGAESSIHARLNAMLSQANDLSSYDDAIARLTKEVKNYEKTGGRGLLGDLNRQIVDYERLKNKTEQRIREQDEAREHLTETARSLDAVERALESRKRELETVSASLKKQEAVEEQRAALAEEIQEKEKALVAIREAFGGAVPETGELEQMRREEQNLSDLKREEARIKEDLLHIDADQQLLIKRYNGEMPTPERLDELQKLAGEMQGVIKAEKDSNQDENVELPQDYEMLHQALEGDPSYRRSLTELIQNQSAYSQKRSALEDLNQELERDEKSWEEKRKNYQAIENEIQKLEKIEESLSSYDPVKIEPVINNLETYYREKEKLATQTEHLKRELATAEEQRKREQTELTGLQAEVEQCRQALTEDSRFSPELLQPVLMQLESLKNRELEVAHKEAEVGKTLLTAEQESILAKYPSASAEKADSKVALEQIRTLQQRQAEKAVLVTKREGEEAKLENLRLRITEAEKETVAALPTQPNQGSNGSLLLILGVVLLLGGIIAAVMVHPMIAVAAVVGLILLIMGLQNQKKGKQALADYEQAMAVARSLQSEKATKLEQYRKDLTIAEEELNRLNDEIADKDSSIKVCRSDIEAWAASWGIQEAVSEELIRTTVDEAEEADRLRNIQTESKKRIAEIQSEKESIRVTRQEIEEKYPELTGKTLEDSLTSLRSAETSFRIKEEQFRSAEERIKAFIASHPYFAPQTEEKDVIREGSDQEQQLNEAEEKLAALVSMYEAILKEYPELSGKGAAQDLRAIREKENAFRINHGKLEVALENQQSFLEQNGWTKEEMQKESATALAQKRLLSETMRHELDTIQARSQELLGKAGFSVRFDNYAETIHNAEQLLNGYDHFMEKVRETEERQSGFREKIAELQEKITGLGSNLPADGDDRGLEERIAAAREDLLTYRQLDAKKEDLLEKERDYIARLATTTEKIRAFTGRYAGFDPEDEAILETMDQKLKAYQELSSRHQALQEQYGKTETQVQKPLNESGDASDLRDKVRILEKQKENLTIEHTHTIEAIRQADQALSQYPDILQELHHLYEEKQNAQNTLSILKRTISLIQKAKENLATRYLSKVEDLFNEYMQIWLANDEIRGILDLDFHIQIEEGNKAHQAEGYSTGYCDLIDFCMRLALVDTLFENEQPFLILDDPFVNLDEERLEKAMELLNVMAADKQIIYMVCHPVRAINHEEDPEIQERFRKLSEAARQNLEERLQENRKHKATKKAASTRKVQTETYRIVPTEKAFNLEPDDPGFIITNNIFSLSFHTTAAINGTATYELFFVDQVGRVLNERQLIEVNGASLSNERKLFCLNTWEDSGDRLDLLVRERGKGDYEIAARFSFEAKMAFAGTSNFF